MGRVGIRQAALLCEDIESLDAKEATGVVGGQLQLIIVNRPLHFFWIDLKLSIVAIIVEAQVHLHLSIVADALLSLVIVEFVGEKGHLIP